MKKKTLLAITALTVLCMGGQSLTVSAAPGNNFHVISGGNSNHILIGYGSDCNQSIQDIVTIIDETDNNLPILNTRFFTLSSFIKSPFKRNMVKRENQMARICLLK